MRRIVQSFLDTLPAAWSAIAWIGLLAALVHVARTRSPQAPLVFRGFALVGFLVTWFFMIRMCREDVAAYTSLAAWWRESNLFFDAYRRVTGSPAAFFLSSQLMSAALVATLLFQRECRRRGEGFWAYAWILMCVAASVTLGLFAGRLEATPQARPARATWPLGLCLAIAAGFLVAVPFVGDTAFPLVMLGLHVALLVPAVGVGAGPRFELGASGERSLLWALAAFCAALHVTAIAGVMRGPTGQFEGILEDPAQASITADLVLTIVGLGIVVGRRAGAKAAAIAMIAAPIVSLGAVMAWMGMERGEG